VSLPFVLSAGLRWQVLARLWSKTHSNDHRAVEEEPYRIWRQRLWMRPGLSFLGFFEAFEFCTNSAKMLYSTQELVPKK
jgi:hypothetical protein